MIDRWPKRDPAPVRALLALACDKGEALSHSERPYSNPMFTGAYHHVVLQFLGDEAVDYGEALLAQLPRHDISLAGKIVAEKIILWSERRRSPGMALTFELQLLLLDNPPIDRPERKIAA